MRTWLLYSATRIKTGQTYVGQTHRDFELRKSEHLSQSVRGCKRFHNAIQFHGPDEFIWNVLVEHIGSVEEADRLEIEYIDKLNAHVSRGGYNLTLGGQGVSGYRHPASSRKKIGDRFRGIPKSEEQRKKMGASISAARKGKKYGPRKFKDPEAAKRNAAEGQRNRPERAHHNHSEETKQNMRHSHGEYHCSVCGEIGHSSKRHKKEIHEALSH